MPRIIDIPVDPIKEPKLFRGKTAGCVDKASPPGGGEASCYHVIDCDQRSPEWFRVRGCRITASAVGKWVTSKGKVADKARHKAVCDAIAAALPPDFPDEWDNRIMARGRELEPQAIRAYEDATGNVCEPVGFCVHESEHFGCSPDSLVNDRQGGLEVKCPLRENMVRWLLSDEPWPADEHGPQVQTSLAVTGLPWWDFWAWHPALPPLLYRVERDETTEAYLAGLIELGEVLSDAHERIAELWDAEFAATNTQHR